MGVFRKRQWSVPVGAGEGEPTSQRLREGRGDSFPVSTGDEGLVGGGVKLRVGRKAIIDR